MPSAFRKCTSYGLCNSVPKNRLPVNCALFQQSQISLKNVLNQSIFNNNWPNVKIVKHRANYVMITGNYNRYGIKTGEFRFIIPIFFKNNSNKTFLDIFQICSHCSVVLIWANYIYAQLLSVHGIATFLVQIYYITLPGYSHGIGNNWLDLQYCYS